MPASADIQAATLNKFLASWREGSAPDTMALWSDDFKQRLLPLSLGESSFRSRDQAAFFYPVLVENLRNWEVRFCFFPQIGVSYSLLVSEDSIPLLSCTRTLARERKSLRPSSCISRKLCTTLLGAQRRFMRLRKLIRPFRARSGPTNTHSFCLSLKMGPRSVDWRK